MRSIRGFTLIELLVSISIIAVLAVIGTTIFSNVKNEAKNSARKADVVAIAKAMEANYDPVSGTYITSKILDGTAFASGSIPIPPEGGEYLGDLTLPPKGFRICTSLISNNPNSCSVPVPNQCFCIDSEQGIYDEISYTTPFMGSASPPPTPTSGPTNTPSPTVPGATNTPTPTTAAPTATPTPTTPVSIANTGSSSNTGAGTSVSVTVPVSTQTGNVIIAQVSIGAATPVVIIGTTPPAGWNFIRSDQIASTNVYSAIYWKVASVSDPGTNYSWTFTGGISGGTKGSITSYSNVNQTTPVDQHGAAQTGSGTTSIIAPSITLAGANDMLLFFGTAAAASSFSVTAPSGMVQRYNIGSATTIVQEGADQLLSSSGATGTRSASTGAQTTVNVGQAVALKQ